MRSHVLDDAALKELRYGFTGDIVMPGDPGYDEARTLFNAMIDRRPAVIARCENVDDFVRAIRFGRELELEVAIRCGGHGVAGTALTEGGMVLDLRRMNAVSVDPEARTATVAGCPPPGSADWFWAAPGSWTASSASFAIACWRSSS